MRRRPSPAAGLRHWAIAFGKPPPEKEKAALPGRANAAYKLDLKQANHTPPRPARQRGRIEVDAILALHLVLLGVLLAHFVGKVIFP